MQVTIEETKARLLELLEQAATGEDIIITGGGLPALRLTRLNADEQALYEPKKGARVAGSAKGQIWMAEDFNETPEEFKDIVE